ncbi:MAG: 4Fe-4S cluster-binding domain-containing protein [Myxococcales bacterium]|nr:4Fe-4S cluster-binding domain-containing protein [Myxococcales bacterium]
MTDNPLKPNALKNADCQQLRLAGLAPSSRVNGPGLRVVVWVQGCDLACPGCFNPGTHGADGPAESIESVAARVLAARTAAHRGVTFSGGEPFQQAAALAALLDAVRAGWPEADAMAFSGYAFEALRGPTAPAGASALRARLDWLVDGRYDARRPGRRVWRASRNQRLWCLGRPLPAGALAGAPGQVAELTIGDEGAVLLSGFPDAGLRRLVGELAR